MTPKEYRICVSDTPANLALEVTELLAAGWELYGYPFAGGSNGTTQVCQAMVRLAAPPQAARTEASTTSEHNFLGDAVVFRSGFYGQFLEPSAPPEPWNACSISKPTAVRGTPARSWYYLLRDLDPIAIVTPPSPFPSRITTTPMEPRTRPMSLGKSAS